MRTFVALEIQEESVLSEMISLQNELRATQADLKIVSRENLHFTVRFLGEITQQQVQEVDRRLKALDLKSVEVAVKGIGAFPSLNHPNVIWAGVATEDRSKIVHLAEQVIEALRGVGQEDDRGFQAHITLARVRSGRNRDSLMVFMKKNAEISFGAAKFDRLKLKSSELTPGGPVYTDIGVYNLR